MPAEPVLVVAVWREPRGEWVLLESGTRVEQEAGAMASSGLHDPDGRVGLGVQSLLVPEGAGRRGGGGGIVAIRKGRNAGVGGAADT